MFQFDEADNDAKREYDKKHVVAGLTISALLVADVKVLNQTKWGLALGPLRKFALINAMTAPVYYYFYTDCMQAHQDLKKHLVTRYLIADGQILYKRKFQ
mmetsp:Transcript_41755/g.55009  ORF Transcript_41755/g.55009 Transcript_41755/m.55009 type:complete len:100 (-) Transcript_41755:90-389(-)